MFKCPFFTFSPTNANVILQPRFMFKIQSKNIQKILWISSKELNYPFVSLI